MTERFSKKIYKQNDLEVLQISWPDPEEKDKFNAVMFDMDHLRKMKMAFGDVDAARSTIKVLQEIMGNINFTKEEIEYILEDI